MDNFQIVLLARLGLLGLFAIFWLVPFFLVGQMRPLPFKVHPRLLTQYACAGLFTKRMSSWNQMFIQARHGTGGEWVTLPMSKLSPMRCFGFRQRLDRLLLVTTPKKNDAGWTRLAEWVSVHPAAKVSGQEQVTAVRIVQQSWPVNSAELMQKGRRWDCQSPDMKSTTAKFYVLKSSEIVDGRALPTAISPRGAEPRIKTPSIFRRKGDNATK